MCRFRTTFPIRRELWVFGRQWPMQWNEAMVVQAFLCFNRDFRIVMSTPLIRHFDESFLADTYTVLRVDRREPEHVQLAVAEKGS